MLLVRRTEDSVSFEKPTYAPESSASSASRRNPAASSGERAERRGAAGTPGVHGRHSRGSSSRARRARRSRRAYTATAAATPTPNAARSSSSRADAEICIGSAAASKAKMARDVGSARHFCGISPRYRASRRRRICRSSSAGYAALRTGRPCADGRAAQAARPSHRTVRGELRPDRAHC